MISSLNFLLSYLSTFVVRFVGVAVTFGSQIFLARILGVENYGAYITAITWVALLLIPSILGTDLTVIRFIAEYNNKNNHSALLGIISWSLIRVLRLSLITSALTLPLVLLIYSKDTILTSLIIALILLPFCSLLRVKCLSILALKNPNIAISIENILRPILFLAILLIVYIFRDTISAGEGLFFFLIATIFTLAFSKYYLWKKIPKKKSKMTLNTVDSDLWKRISLGMFWVAVFYQILSSVDILIISKLIDQSKAGLYSVACKITSLFNYLLIAVSAIAGPRFAELYSNNKLSEIEQYSRKISFLLIIIASPLAIILLLFSNQILFTFGSDFIDAKNSMLILVITEFTYLVSGPACLILTMTGHQNQLAKLLFFISFIYLVLNFSLTPNFGIIAASWVRLACAILLCIYSINLVNKSLRINPTVFNLRKFVWRTNS